MQAVETYDWRLSLPNLQKRDKYFTRVQKRVELLREIHEEKVSSFHRGLLPKNLDRTKDQVFQVHISSSLSNVY